MLTAWANRQCACDEGQAAEALEVHPRQCRTPATHTQELFTCCTTGHCIVHEVILLCVSKGERVKRHGVPPNARVFSHPSVSLLHQQAFLTTQGRANRSSCKTSYIVHRVKKLGKLGWLGKLRGEHEGGSVGTGTWEHEVTPGQGATRPPTVQDAR